MQLIHSCLFADNDRYHGMQLVHSCTFADVSYLQKTAFTSKVAQLYARWTSDQEVDEIFQNQSCNRHFKNIIAIIFFLALQRFCLNANTFFYSNSFFFFFFFFFFCFFLFFYLDNV